MGWRCAAGVVAVRGENLPGHALLVAMMSVIATEISAAEITFPLVIIIITMYFHVGQPTTPSSGPARHHGSKVTRDSRQCAAFASPSVAHATPAVALHVHVSHTRPTEQPSELLCELHCPLKWVLDQTRRLGITLTVILDSGVVVLAAVRVFWGASLHLAWSSDMCTRSSLRCWCGCVKYGPKGSRMDVARRIGRNVA